MKQSVDEKLLRQKLEMWQKKVADLEKEYEVTMVARGEAAREGDLRENAAYQMLTEKGEFISAQIGNTKKIIIELKSQLGEEMAESA
jgi:transcription elongation GreA/GreB family factor